MKIKFKPLLKVLAVYGPQLWLIFFVANIAVIAVVRTAAQSQTCLTTAQISTDSRCLYIYQGSIYEKGSRSSPHHGHSCGSDVSNILPSSHVNAMSQYLLPNYVGSVCSGNPVPTATPTQTPSPTPTHSPSPSPTVAPTQRPTNAPTAAPTAAPTTSPTAAPTQAGATQHPTTSPTHTPTPTSTLIAANKTAAPTKTPTPAAAPLSTPAPLQTPTPTPQPTSMLIAFMNAIDFAKVAPSPTPVATTENGGALMTAAPVTPQPTTNNQNQYNLLYWTTILSYISFVILLITGIYMLVQKIKLRLKAIDEAKNAPVSSK